MGKMNEFSQAIDELRRCGDALIGVADSLRERFSDNSTEVEAQPTVEAAKPALTLEQVRAALAEKSRGGYTAQVRELLEGIAAHDREHIQQLQAMQSTALLQA